MKVLIVEDNPDMRQMLIDFVADKFEKIYQCADGDEAFAIYELHHPDWVLMDWQMPNSDGIAATREIIAEYPAARICLVTSFDDEFLRAEALEAGARCFVLKRDLSELQRVFSGI